MTYLTGVEGSDFFFFYKQKMELIYNGGVTSEKSINKEGERR